MTLHLSSSLLSSFEALQDSRGAQRSSSGTRWRCRLLFLLQRDVACSNGRAMAQVITSQHHLWLAQSRLPAALQNTFATLPITPGLTFGPEVNEILEQTDEVHRDRRPPDGSCRLLRPPVQSRRTVATHLHLNNGDGGVPLLPYRLVLRNDSGEEHSVRWSNNLSTFHRHRDVPGQPRHSGRQRRGGPRQDP